MNSYRFDDQYQAVYAYSSSASAYYYMCSYLQADITTRMSDARKQELADKYEDDTDPCSYDD